MLNSNKNLNKSKSDTYSKNLLVLYKKNSAAFKKICGKPPINKVLKYFSGFVMKPSYINYVVNLNQ